MNWICGLCGSSAKTNRKKCPKCGSMNWRPVAKKDLRELSAPIKRIAPKGLILTNPEKKRPSQDSGWIECGKCHKVIYKADKGFDEAAFKEARKKHYSLSPTCEHD
jgi:phage FluMu protein Com